MITQTKPTTREITKAPAASGKLTSANRSSPCRHTAVSPWNAGPYP